MRYRIHKRTGDKISEIGMGSSYLFQAGIKEGINILRHAVEGGINYFDLAAGHGMSFPIYGEALQDVRKNVFLQIHFGADYSNGDYGWSLNLNTVKKSIAKQLKDLKTDYIDYGFIHCQDEISDWEKYQRNGIFDYILKLKDEGVVKHIGLSSHTPKVIQKILDTGMVDTLTFSINPAYDYGEGDYAVGSVNERNEVYRRCEKDGIGISVMKPFSGGQLLDAKLSPFGVALNPYRCIRYALDRPGVITVLPGVQKMHELEMLLQYDSVSNETSDYGMIGRFATKQAIGKCVYCNHCKPCPVGIDIGLINKYYDLAQAGDVLAVEHYHTLEKKANDCIQCGHCNTRCPFSVKQKERMKEIAAFFVSK